MSIWSSFCTFGASEDSRPYMDWNVPSTGKDINKDAPADQYAELPRGGFLDLASTWIPLLRVSVEGENGEVFLDAEQVKTMRDALDRWLEHPDNRPPPSA